MSYDEHSIKPIDDSKIYELSLELEALKLSNKILQDENSDLRERLSDSNVTEQELEDIQNRFYIIDDIVLERNDLRELFDKVLELSDKMVEIKAQADQMKHLEGQYISLQKTCQEHKTELDLLRNEKKLYEKRHLEIPASNEEIDSLKVLVA